MEESNYYLEKAPIGKAIANLSIPIMVGMSISVIYNIVDAFFIGMLHNSNMLAAVSLSLPIFAVFMAIGNLFGIGCGTYISRLLGEKNYDKLKNASSFSFYISIAVGVICIIFAMPFINFIVSGLGANSDIFSYTKEYIVVMIIGGPFIILNFTLEQIVRSEGAAKVSMIGITLSCVINMILDPILIIFFKLGVTGAALGTLIGNIISVLYFMFYITKKSSVLSVRIKDFKITKDILSNTFKIGIPAFILSFFLIISSLLLNNFSALYGDKVLAGFALQSRITQLPEFIAMGLAEGIVPLIAFNYAAKNNERLVKAIKQTVFYILIIVVCISGLIYIFSSDIIRLFSQDYEVINIGTYILRVTLISTFFSGITTLIVGMFQAFGKGKQAFVMSITQGTLFIPILVVCNSLFAFHGLVWALPLTEICTFIVAVALLIPLRGELSANKSCELIKEG